MIPTVIQIIAILIGAFFITVLSLAPIGLFNDFVQRRKAQQAPDSETSAEPGART
jgi:uncharacterized membrane protein (Fun14 family)